MGQPTRRHVSWMVGSAVTVIIVALIWIFVGRTSSGDPGARVMNQLSPTVSALPGYGTSVQWVGQIPETLGTSYAVKIAPFQDSCDGMAGTQGWSSVVVQAGFRWHKNIAALVNYMEPQLKKLGWSARSRSRFSENQYWFKRLSNGTLANVSVDREGFPNNSYWQLDAIGKPVGRAASGC